MRMVSNDRVVTAVRCDWGSYSIVLPTCHPRIRPFDDAADRHQVPNGPTLPRRITATSKNFRNAKKVVGRQFNRGFLPSETPENLALLKNIVHPPGNLTFPETAPRKPAAS